MGIKNCACNDLSNNNGDKPAIVVIDAKITAYKHLAMQVHDKLVFKIQESIIESSIEQIKSTVCNAEKLSVPLDVAIGIGDN